MLRLLIKRFIPNGENVSDPAVRTAYGMLCGALGVALNLLLFAGKLFAGISSGSIAVTGDALNNLTDAGSSIITLLGFKLAGQKPDLEHPFGHGRIEYVSGLIVALVILLVGVELGKASIEKIISPAEVEFSWLAAGILAVSIAVKLYMALYNRAVGKKIGSAAVSAVSLDSLSDCVATAVVLATMLAARVFGLNIDGFCGLAVAAFIVWAGLKAAKETISPLLGTPPEPEFVRQIEELVRAGSEVLGIHDLIVHDYGPGRRVISLHAEVDAGGNLLHIHDAIDNLERELTDKTGCLAVIHMDPVETNDELTRELRETVTGLVRELDAGLSIHDFRIVAGPTHTNLIFDVVAPYKGALSDEELKRRVAASVRGMEGNYFAVVCVDRTYVG